MVTLITSNLKDQREVWGIEKQLNEGEGTIYRGATNVGVPAGPCVSPQYKDALNEF